MMIMLMSQLVRSTSLVRLACARLNPYDRQYHCEKQIPYDIRGKSILLLGHLGAFYRRIGDT
jgi:hypothetical protein